MSVIVVGLTGGIGTGKSTVAKVLAQAGVPVIDADQVARDVVAPGKPALAAIVEAFGPAMVTASGALDRGAMRNRIAHDADARKTLEAITHPAIRTAIVLRLDELRGEGVPAAVVEAALMVETGSYKQYQGLIVVTCDPETQLRRVLARDGRTEDEARALIASQMPLTDKEAVATHVIRNDGTLQELQERTHQVWAALMAPLR